MLWAGCENGLENCETRDRKSRLLEAVAAGKEEGEATSKEWSDVGTGLVLEMLRSDLAQTRSRCPSGCSFRS